MNLHDVGMTVLAGDFIGMFNIRQAQRNMNALQPVTFDIARILVNSARSVISDAILGAKQPWYKSDLPGDTARKNVLGHLDWHIANLAKYPELSESEYASGDDAKKWAMQAYIEANAVEEGAAYIDKAWNDMWAEIEEKLAAIPKAIGKAAASALKSAAAAAGEGAAAGLGIPTWLFWAGGATALGLVGYVLFKRISR